MNVLITGGAGYIGSHAVLAFRDKGYRPVVVDDLSTGRRSLVPADVPFVEANVGEAKRVIDVIGSTKSGRWSTLPAASAWRNRW